MIYLNPFNPTSTGSTRLSKNITHTRYCTARWPRKLAGSRYLELRRDVEEVVEGDLRVGRWALRLGRLKTGRN